jgi:hypothetical protein
MIGAAHLYAVKLQSGLLIFSKKQKKVKNRKSIKFGPLTLIYSAVYRILVKIFIILIS